MKVSQIIKTEGKDLYKSSFNPSEKLYIPNSSYDNFLFYETAIKVDTMKQGESFYFEIPIVQYEGRRLEIEIEFTNSENYNIKERIKTVTVGAGNGVEIIKFIASPKSNSYNCIVFKTKKVASDFSTIIYTTRGGLALRGGTVFFTSKNGDVDTINNIKGYKLDNLIAGKNIRKLGIRGIPGTYMAINSEEIRIGYSGVYEVLNGITLQYFGIMTKPEDTFILDLQEEDL